MSAIDLDQFKNRPEPEPEPDYVPFLIPAGEVVLKDGSRFIVDEPGNIQWHPKGFLASGRWQRSDEDKDILFFDEAVAFIDFDFKSVMDDGESPSD